MKTSKQSRKLYYLIGGCMTCAGLFHFLISPYLLGLWGLRWRAIVNCIFSVITVIGVSMVVIRPTLSLFRPVNGKPFLTMLRIFLGIFCVNSCVVLIMFGFAGFSYSNVSETVVQRDGKDYVHIEDDYAGHHNILYPYHGFLVMGKDRIEDSCNS